MKVKIHADGAGTVLFVLVDEPAVLNEPVQDAFDHLALGAHGESVHMAREPDDFHVQLGTHWIAAFRGRWQPVLMACRKALTISRNRMRGRTNRLGLGSSGLSGCHIGSAKSVAYGAFSIDRVRLPRRSGRSSPPQNQTLIAFLYNPLFQKGFKGSRRRPWSS